MKIKMTNSSIGDVLNVLMKFDNCEGKLSYAIHKTKRKLINEYKDFEEIRNNLIRKYGEKDEETGNYLIRQDSEGFQKYKEEIMPISQDIVEVEIHQITQEEFDNSDYYNENVSTKEYDLLEALFVKREDEE